MLTSSQSIRYQNNLLAMLQQQNDSLKQQLYLANKQISQLKSQVNNLQQQLKQHINPIKQVVASKSNDKMKINEMENYEQIFTNSDQQQNDDCMSSSISSQLQSSFKISTPVSIKRINSKRKQHQNNIKIDQTLSNVTTLNLPLLQRPHINQSGNKKIQAINTTRRKKISIKDLELSSKSSNSGFFNDNAHFPIQTQEAIPTLTHHYSYNIMTPQSNAKSKPRGLQRVMSQLPVRQSVAIFENSLHISENSSSKGQSKIFEMKTQTSKIHNKQKNSNKIFQIFFVTGYSITPQNIIPEILYYYPKMSSHFGALLDLLFGDIPLKTCQLHSHQIFPMQLKIKDTFIMPLKKEGSEGRQMQYLFALQTQELLYDGKENYGFIVPRMYCFITEWKFFNQFKSLTCQLVKTVEHKRNSMGRNLTQLQLKSLLKRQLENSLERLACKIIQKNQTIRISEIENMRIQIDIPSQQEDYKMIAQYRHWRILDKQVRIRNDQIGKFCETSLLAALSIYMLMDNKIILFSATKSKISQALFNCLEIIKPFEYVNPIIMGSYRDLFEEYIEAPIPLILGVWHQQKKSKQKLQIFVTKRLNMIALIQNGKLNVEDGVIFNLDTGLIFGGAVNEQLNTLIRQFHVLLSFTNGNRSNQFQHFKIFKKMVEGKEKTGNEINKFWKKLQSNIFRTQLYCYYQQNLSKKI